MSHTKYAITELLTHRAPMIFIDSVDHFDEETLRASVEIHDQSPFIYGQSVPAYISIEYMAQAVACHGGIKARNANLSVRDGYLVSTRRLSLNVVGFPVGSKLSIHTSTVFNYDEMTAFDCKILQGSKMLSSAQLNVYQPFDSSKVNL